MPYLTEEQLARALTLADLTDPAYGPHCMQQLVAGATGALRERWGCPVLVHRAERVVAVADNYDALGYPPDGPARESRYTRYVDAGRLLRSQTSAAVPVGPARAGADVRPTTCSCARPGSSTGATRSTACTSASPTSSTCGASPRARWRRSTSRR